MIVNLGLAFKDFAYWLYDTSSVALNVASYTTAQVLREHHINTTVFPVRHNIDLVDAIIEYDEKHPRYPLTHFVISAPWLSAFDLEAILRRFQEIQFVVLSHSNIGFLQADARGVENLREYQRLEDKYSNLKVGGNNINFVAWMNQAYSKPIIYLPNLYPIHNARRIQPWDGVPPLKIGGLGAVRPYKNIMTAAAAALLIQTRIGLPVEFYMSEGGEGDNGMITPAIEAMLENTGVTLIKYPWAYWNNFIELVKSMDLLIQVSYTESFNLITADGVLSGVPSVVSEAVRWAPNAWKADSDDVLEVAKVGLELLYHPDAEAGIDALEHSNKQGIKQWLKFLGAI